jgi:transcriptional regulator with XRE-family HTH domain
MAARSIVKGFAAAVRQYRTVKGLTQEKLAFEADLHRNYISGLERGIKNPSLTTIESLAKALAVSGSELVARAEKASK